MSEIVLVATGSVLGHQRLPQSFQIPISDRTHSLDDLIDILEFIVASSEFNDLS